MSVAPVFPRESRAAGTLLSVVLILLAFTLFSAIVAWILHLSGTVEDVEAKRAIERVEFLHKVRSRDAAALNSYGLTDPASGLARIPVPRAAELVVDRLKAKPILPADLIPPPPPATAPAPAAPLPTVTPATKEGAPKAPKAA